MKFGVFDHLDHSGTSIGELFEQRLQLIEAYDRAGIYCYHLAEHHATPLGMSPSPSVFLAAVAQRTKRLLFGPLVYTLAFYHPLRLAEEICMLDHLSNGRFQLGVGRGVSPIELQYYGVEMPKAQPIYLEAYSIIMKALTAKTLTHEGEFFQFHDVPIHMHPLQRPHPPLWYGLGNPGGVAWVARNRINSVSLGPPPMVRVITDRYREAWATLGHDPAQMPLMGLLRHVVVADTDAEALATARRAYARYHASFWYLWNNHNKSGAQPPYAVYPASFDELMGRGQAIAGSPDTVRTMIEAQMTAAGTTYLLLDLAFGEMKHEESLRSLDLLARHVMPALA